MKVLMFGWEFPPYNSGGLGVACQGLARALAARNVDLTFVLPRKVGVNENGVRFRFADVPNMSVEEIDSLLVPYITSEKYKLLVDGVLPGGQYGATLFEEVRRYGVLARALAKRERFDVVHAHDWLSFAAGMSAKDVSGKPMVAHVHATEVDRTAGNPNTHIYSAEREGVHFADRVVSVSDFTRNVLNAHYGVPKGKIDVVHNGIDTENYEVSGESPSGIVKLKKMGYKVVLFVGRITIMKGADYLIHAAKRVLEYDKKVVFVIVGSGDMEGQIMREAASMGISNKVLFPGFLRGKELSDAYKSADLFVMPSVAEPFGLTSLESLVHGTPVLISKQSGVSEVLQNALKTDFWDVDDMADKILSVLKHKSLHNELAQNGRRDALGCNWDKAAEKCEGIYSQLI
jgi:glycosyltransferase involved in cell wall biosynthesis